MTRDRAHLQRWYRQAMRDRAAELRGLRGGISEGDPDAAEHARSVGMALRGSGATFGFPHITEVSTLVETAREEDLLRRTEGLISQLDALARTEDGARDVFVPEWLARAAGIADVPAVGGAGDLTEAWSAVARAAGFDRSALTGRVAEYFGLEVADLGNRNRAALRLVPEALVTTNRVMPMREDSDTITVATADPTALATERQLEALTGRRPIFVVAPPEAIDALIDGMHDAADSPPQRVATETTDATPVPVEQPAPAGEGGAVLVVDDEPSARLLVRSLLERRGYRVIEAEDGVAALEALGDASGVGLVIADLNMPRMDGLELIWELRDAHPAARLPVIVVTGEGDEILETQLMEEGADDYIRKPIDPRLFLARVESTVRRLGAQVARAGAGPESG